ncbi:EF-hand domain-containing protein [Actinocorallia sp. API 0066]|uniref:EF-hand domain-containing protein n=1 Tax=Actinocorallia sp. API 0066 TaxID=2896846 RepID=UPI001E5524A9|nr:EF-hand domain-containing protein [Actinocorallia sp. API 0066]MCD0447950.1 EF-hand domain-containing protein [Actinocorallia sp. API 0066]
MTNEINTAEYKATFDLIDADGDGYIDVAELGGLMRALGKEAGTARVVEVMVAADVSKDGRITLGEFAAFLQKANL